MLILTELQSIHFTSTHEEMPKSMWETVHSWHWGHYQIRTLNKARLKSNTYSEGQFLASEDPDARDAAVVVSAEQDDTGKGILSEFVQALEHTCEVQPEIWDILIFINTSRTSSIWSISKGTSVFLHVEQKQKNKLPVGQFCLMWPQHEPALNSLKTEMTGMNMACSFSSPVWLRLCVMTGHCLAQWQGNNCFSPNCSTDPFLKLIQTCPNSLQERHWRPEDDQFNIWQKVLNTYF